MLTQEDIAVLSAPIPKGEIKTKQIKNNVIRYTSRQFVEDRIAVVDPSFGCEVTITPKAVAVHYTVKDVRRGGSADVIDVSGYGSPVKNAEAQAAKRAAARFGVAAELWEKEVDDDDEDDRPRNRSNYSNDRQSSGKSSGYGKSTSGGDGPSEKQISFLTGKRLQVPEAIARQLSGGREGAASKLIDALLQEAGDEYDENPMPFIKQALSDLGLKSLVSKSLAKNVTPRHEDDDDED